MRDVTQHEPRCVQCSYLLRGLPESRCPECGTPFRLEEPATVDLGRGRNARILSRPLGPAVYRWQLITIFAMVWGFALLPGGIVVAVVGMVAALGIYAFRHLHRASQLFILGPSTPSLIAVTASYRRAMLAALLLVALTNVDVPAMLTASAVKVFARHQFDKAPSTSFPRQFRVIGCTVAQYENVTPAGVWIDVLGWGTLVYDFNGDDLVARPCGHRAELQFMSIRMRFAGTLIYGL